MIINWILYILAFAGVIILLFFLQFLIADGIIIKLTGANINDTKNRKWWNQKLLIIVFPIISITSAYLILAVGLNYNPPLNTKQIHINEESPANKINALAIEIERINNTFEY